MSKLAVVVGHNAKQVGAAAGPPISSYEFPFNSKVAESMVAQADQFDFEIKIFWREYLGPYRTSSGRSTGNYAKEIKQVYALTNDWGADLSIELHYNSFHDRSVSGTEVLSSGSSKSLQYANITQDKLVALFERRGRTNRGVKVRNATKRGRGYLSLVSGVAPAILVEPFFGSIQSDCLMMADIGFDGLAKCYLDAANEYFLNV